MTDLMVNGIQIELNRKKVKYLRLSVHPPLGIVKVSAPLLMKTSMIEKFVLAKTDWIQKQQVKIKNRKIQKPKKYITGENHYFEGRAYSLRVNEVSGSRYIKLHEAEIELFISPGSSLEKKVKIFDEWYRNHLKSIIPKFIEKWEPRMGVRVNEFGIKKMKTRWGTCNARVKRIWLNLELAKRPLECLEYVIVHEMAHLIEAGHGPRFKAIMDRHLPNWRFLKKQLMDL